MTLSHCLITYSFLIEESLRWSAVRVEFVESALDSSIAPSYPIELLLRSSVVRVGEFVAICFNNFNHFTSTLLLFHIS